jgi:hypothetical protein
MGIQLQSASLPESGGYQSGQSIQIALPQIDEQEGMSGKGVLVKGLKQTKCPANGIKYISQ